jgi:hypothetical protein
MKRTLVLGLAAVLSFTFTISIAAQKRPIASQNAGREIYGTTSNKIYTNNIIGIKLQVPQEMEVMEPSFVDLKLVAAVKGSVFAGQNLIVKNLVFADVHPVSFGITAMKLPVNLSNLNGEDILNDPLFKRPIDPTPKREQLGNAVFAYSDSRIGQVDHRAYAIVRRGYYISIVLSYQSTEDLDVMREYLAAANFNWNGR